MTLNTQTIRLSAGAVEYTWPVTLTETTGKDITADTVRLAVGTPTTPGAWLAPDVDTHTVVSQRVVQLLIGGTVSPAVGHWVVWARINDNPETVPRPVLALNIV